MTKLLEEAIGRAQKLPAEEQDRIAELILGFAGDTSRLRLTNAQLAEVERARAAARSGAFATDAEMAELWKRFGL
jgi:hypothetical protein